MPVDFRLGTLAPRGQPDPNTRCRRRRIWRRRVPARSRSRRRAAVPAARAENHRSAEAESRQRGRRPDSGVRPVEAFGRGTLDDAGLPRCRTDAVRCLCRLRVEEAVCLHRRGRRRHDGGTDEGEGEGATATVSRARTRTRNFVLDRVHGDFSARDRAVLEAVRPHLRLIHEMTELRRALGDSEAEGTDRLTSREAEILELVAAGLTNAAIAEQLWVSPGTKAPRERLREARGREPR